MTALGVGGGRWATMQCGKISKRAEDGPKRECTVYVNASDEKNSKTKKKNGYQSINRANVHRKSIVFHSFSSTTTTNTTNTTKTETRHREGGRGYIRG
jgi:hypothetical protein